MFRRRFLNIIVQNCSDDVFSLYRINLSKNLFYESTEKAQEAAANEKRKKMFDKTMQRFPGPITSFDPSPTGVLPMPRGLEWFELFAPRSSEGRIINSTKAGGMAMFDADKNRFLTLPSLSHPKGFDPLTVSITHPGADEDSLYMMDMYPGRAVNPPQFSAHAQPRSCFEVLEYMPKCRDESDDNKRWRMRLLPPPPFVDLPGYKPSLVTSYTTLVTANGCSSICISTGNAFGTYCFDTACLDKSHRLGWRTLEEWRHIGDWALPFDGRAEYVPEFNTWLGFEAPEPFHLCAVDLSAMDHGQPPTVQYRWEDLSLSMKDDLDWSLVRLKLVNLGDGRFCIAKVYNDYENGVQFTVFTGIEILRDRKDQSLRIVKHKCTRYMSRTDTVRWVL